MIVNRKIHKTWQDNQLALGPEGGQDLYLSKVISAENREIRVGGVREGDECWDNWRGVQEGGRREKQVEQFKEGARRKIFVRTENQVKKISKSLANS